MGKRIKSLTWEDYMLYVPSEYRMKKEKFTKLVDAFPGLLVDAEEFWNEFYYEGDDFVSYLMAYATGNPMADMFDFDEVDIDDKTYVISNDFNSDEFISISEKLSQYGWEINNKEKAYHDAISNDIGVDFERLLEGISQMPKTAQQYVVRKIRLACSPK